MTRVRLLEVGLCWPPETFVEWKLTGLAARGFEVTVAPSPPVRDGVVLPGVRLVPNPQHEPAGRARTLRAYRSLLALALLAPGRCRALLRALAREHAGAGRAARLRTAAAHARLARLRPDVVHFEWTSQAAYRLPLFEVWGCPIVLSCHGGEVSVYPSALPDNSAVRRLPELFERAAAVHCVSLATQRDAEAVGLDPAKAVLVRNGVDPERFSPGPPRVDASAPLRVVAVGHVDWIKAYEYAIEAIGLLVAAGADVTLDLVGSEPAADHGSAGDLERVEHTIADLGLGERVRLLGQVPSSQVRDLLRGADVLLHASLSEGLPTVVLEAMACGLPVVTTDCGGVAEALRDGVDGFVVPLREAPALAAALGRLAADPALRARLGASARARICETFTLDGQLAGYEALYTRVLAGRGRRC